MLLVLRVHVHLMALIISVTHYVLLSRMFLAMLGDTFLSMLSLSNAAEELQIPDLNNLNKLNEFDNHRNQNPYTNFM